MDIDQCRSILQKACEKCESDWIALSGGLDSSVIANLMKKEKTHAITIITKILSEQISPMHKLWQSIWKFPCH